MATYTQYRGNYNNNYSSASNAVLNNKIPLFKDYIQFRSADDQYVLIIGDTKDGYNFTDATVYTVDGTSGSYTFNVTEEATTTAVVTNDYYTYGSYTYSYYNQYQLNQALTDSVIGFSLTGGIAICVILALLRRLFSRRR